MSGMEAIVAELNDKIKAYEESIRELKSVVETKDKLIAKLKESNAKQDNAIRALTEVVQDKTSECKDLNKRLEAQSKKTSRSTRNGGSASELSARTKTLEGQKLDAEKELNKTKDALLKLETDLKLKTEENTSFCNQLLENKSSLAELREKIRIRDEYLDKIGSCVDKLLIEDIDSKSEDSTPDDVSKMAGILSRMSSLCAQMDNSGREPISSPPPLAPERGLAFSLSPSSSELHPSDRFSDSNHGASPETTRTYARPKKALPKAKTRAKETVNTDRVLLEQMREEAAAAATATEEMADKLNLGTIAKMQSGDTNASAYRLFEDMLPSRETNEAEAESITKSTKLVYRGNIRYTWDSTCPKDFAIFPDGELVIFRSENVFHEPMIEIKVYKAHEHLFNGLSVRPGPMAQKYIRPATLARQCRKGFFKVKLFSGIILEFNSMPADPKLPLFAEMMQEHRNLPMTAYGLPVGVPGPSTTPEYEAANAADRKYIAAVIARIKRHRTTPLSPQNVFARRLAVYKRQKGHFLYSDTEED